MTKRERKYLKKTKNIKPYIKDVMERILEDEAKRNIEYIFYNPPPSIESFKRTTAEDLEGIDVEPFPPETLKD